MRTMVLALLLLVTVLLSACETADGSGQRSGYRDRYGGMCSPYASNCW